MLGDRGVDASVASVVQQGQSQGGSVSGVSDLSRSDCKTTKGVRDCPETTAPVDDVELVDASWEYPIDPVVDEGWEVSKRRKK